jgi:hypothetical protein
MNRETHDFLSAAELASIQSDTDDLMSDVHVSVAITYRDFQGLVRDPKTGTSTTTYTDTNLRALRRTLSAREVQAGAGLFQVGDLHLRIAKTDLPITPLREDRIVVGSDTYEVVFWDTGTLGLTWLVVARRVK